METRIVRGGIGGFGQLAEVQIPADVAVSAGLDGLLLVSGLIAFATGHKKLAIGAVGIVAGRHAIGAALRLLHPELRDV